MKGAAGAVAGQLVRLPKLVPFFVLSIPARFRRKLGVALLAAVLLTAAYMLWLRDSSLVAIEKVQVSGLTTRDAPKVREALTAAARDMTTLHVDRDRLLEAASAWPVVNDLRVVSDFPHGVRIEAVERRPVALVKTGGESVPVSEDGTVIQGLKGKPKLPEVDRKLLAAAGAAPPFLLERVKTISRTDRGLVAELNKGPEIVLGAQTRLRAKWAAAAAVMADEGAKGAKYIDVRLPERPVAGGLPAPEPEPGETPAEEEPADPGVTPDATLTAPQATPQVTPQTAPQAAPQAAPQPVTPQAQP